MKTVEPNRWVLYRERADAFLEAMKLCHEQDPYKGAVPLLAVHACISLADSILVCKTGQRGTDDHTESSRALRKLCTSSLRVPSAGIRHFELLVSKRTAWIYGDRAVSRPDVDLAYTDDWRGAWRGFATPPA